MKHKIIGVLENSIAEELGIQAGDYLLGINGKKVEDVLDYQYYESLDQLSVAIEKQNGEAIIYDIEKDDDEMLGLCFEEDDMLKVRRCANKCIFCFVDQLPANMRSTMYVKDDDWRLSFMMGNFITLTNLSERDIQRIITQKISPLYISVHTTDPQLRVQMLGNKNAGQLMNILQRFAQNDIYFHTQVVLCPEINDGYQLRKTFEDLLVLHPHCMSLAVVPVGLTYHRRGLERLKRFDQQTANHVLEDIERWQENCLSLKGTRFIYAADELYVTANRELPKYETYENFPQLENGVGMLAKFEHELDGAIAELPPWILDRTVSIACGVSAEKFIRRMCDKLCKKYTNLTVHVYPVRNFFFGDSVTVTGLLTGKDIAVQLEGKKLGEELLISRTMLRAGTETFLDDITVSDLASWINHKVTPVDNDGEAFAYAVLGLEKADIFI